MKLKLTTALLLAVLAIPNLYADEPAGALPATQENQATNTRQAVAEVLFSAAHASAPAETTPASRPASKTAKTASSSTTRKVATDYAPAQDLLLSAMSLIGVKYKWGGNTPDSGLDCSGFIKYVFQNTLNIALPRTALGMSRVGDTINKEELKPGDLVFFNTLKREFSHVGIYLGDNRFIHSPRAGKSVEVSDMTAKYWTARYNGARRMSELDHENIDIAALLENRPARVASTKANTAETSGPSCRKVTSVRKGKKVTTTVCSKPAKTKVAAAKATKKPAKATAQKSVKKKATAKPKATARPKKKTS